MLVTLVDFVSSAFGLNNWLVFQSYCIINCSLRQQLHFLIICDMIGQFSTILSFIMASVVNLLCGSTGGRYDRFLEYLCWLHMFVTQVVALVLRANCVLEYMLVAQGDSTSLRLAGLVLQGPGVAGTQSCGE